MQTSTTPLVSIGLPTYNGARFLRETIDSLLSQELRDFELVISNNGSTDATEAICLDASKDPRVRYLPSDTNRGAAWNYNRVLGAARAPYFKWAADDDLCLPPFLARCVEILERSTSAVLAWPQTLLIDGHDEVIGQLDDHDLEVRGEDPAARLAALLRHRVEWHPVFGVIRTDVLRATAAIGPFVYADIALLGELALRGEFHQVPDPLFHRRYHRNRSLIANPSFQAHLAWYDPALSKRRAVLPNVRLVWELIAGAMTAPVKPSVRVRAAAAILDEWAVPHWRHIGGEVKQAMAERARA